MADVGSHVLVAKLRELGAHHDAAHAAAIAAAHRHRPARAAEHQPSEAPHGK